MEDRSFSLRGFSECKIRENMYMMKAKKGVSSDPKEVGTYAR